MRVLSVCLFVALLVGACGTDETEPAVPEPAATTTVADAVPVPTTSEPIVEPEPGTQSPATLYPDVLGADATSTGDGTWTFMVTLSSPYDSPERYADAWRVLAPDGTELGVRILTHDHGAEQPFTRSLRGVEIPVDVAVVTIEGRDQISGWGGATIDVELPTG